MRTDWHKENKSLDFNGMVSRLREAPNGSSVLLHAVAHNPTGVDPTAEQWKQIVALAQEKQFVVLLDNAYQGFASGDLEKDRYNT